MPSFTTAITVTFRVTCIRKRGSHYNPHERIQAISGADGLGRRNSFLEDEAIRLILGGTHEFWTTANGKSVWVVVAEHNGRKYLKTEADGYEPNNLLALPECP